MKFLIAGFGSIGRRHLRNLIALGQNDIVLYRSQRSTLPVDEIASLPVETDLQAALAHRPDAVIISNPTALHLDVAIPAAEAGCHILIEKPVSHSLERLDDLAQALRRGGGRLLVGFQFRFHPTLQKAAALIASGALGRLVSIRAQWGEYLPDWHPWEDYRASYAARADLGGGVILTLSHPFDYLRMLAGEVSEVFALAQPLPELNLEVDGAADVLLRFSGGVVANVHLDYLRRPGRHALEVVATDGILEWDNASGVLAHHQAGAEKAETFAPPAGFERNQMFLDQMSHFLAVIQDLEQPVCGLADGRRALEIALAALESSRSRRSISI